MLWVLKVVPGIPGLRQLRRVLVLESGPLLSVLVIFLMVVFLGLGRRIFPRARRAAGDLRQRAGGAVVGGGDADHRGLWRRGADHAARPHGRGAGDDLGLGVFGLWTGILATGFAAETRRDNFLKTWESVSKVPFFAALGPAAIADVTHMLRTMDLPPRTMIIRKGQQGDCMYFIAAGEVEVDLPGKKVTLGEGAFFGEMALLGNNHARGQYHHHAGVAAAGA